MPIYAAFDQFDVCLYVGETYRHPTLRWREHSDKPWFMSAVRWEILRDLTELSAFDRLQPVYGERANASKEIPYEKRVERETVEQYIERDVIHVPTPHSYGHITPLIEMLSIDFQTIMDTIDADEPYPPDIDRAEALHDGIKRLKALRRAVATYRTCHSMVYRT